MSDFDSSVTYLPIPGYPGYLVGDDGSVWSCKNSRWKPSDRWKRLKPWSIQDGYLVVELSRNGKRWAVQVSRLVLMVFVGPCPPGMEACHGDDDRANNRLSNLEWDTHKNNLDQRNERGRQARGEGHGFAKLKESDIRNIFILSALGFTQRHISGLMGIGRVSICEILNGKKWRHVTRNKHATTHR